MRYLLTTEEQLTTLQQGLDILGHIHRDLLPSTLYLYGMLKSDSPILAEVDEAVWEDQYAGEVSAESIDIKTACVTIRLSDDILRALLGSGLKCENSDIIYVHKDEIHTSSFSYTERKPIITLAQFSKMALADDSYYAEDFVKAEGLLQDKQNPSVITRTKPIGEHGGAAGELHAPHKSSLNVQKIADFLISGK